MKWTKASGVWKLECATGKPLYLVPSSSEFITRNNLGEFDTWTEAKRVAEDMCAERDARMMADVRP